MSGRTREGSDGEGIATAGKAPHPGDLYAHFAEHHAELKVRYPGQFQGKNLGLCWPDGWHALVAGVCAYYMLKKRHAQFARRTMLWAAAVGLILAISMPFIGHWGALVVAEYQPVKMAAVDQSRAGLYRATAS